MMHQGLVRGGMLHGEMRALGRKGEWAAETDRGRLRAE